MIGFAAVAASVVITGYGAASSLWKRFAVAEAPRAFERAASAIVAGAALWIAANWILAIAHLLTFVSLTIVAALFGAAAAATLWRHRAAFHLPIFRGVSLAMLPVVLWMIFILWRSAIVPPLSHDALAYHLPKAVMIMQAHGYETFQAADLRIVTLPANYELLLADVLILSGSDRLTEWLAAIAYLAMLILTGAFAERWWRSDGSALAASILTVAATPIFLLHSGADKNDLMTAFFCGATLLWGGRWCARGGRMPLLLAILSLALAVGTKPNGAAVAIGLAPFIAWRAWRGLRESKLTVRDLLLFVAVAIVAFALLGAASYVYARIPMQTGAPETHHAAAPIAYGDWANLWQVPYLVLTAPFSPDARRVWAPWELDYWYWPRYEIYFSNYGQLFTLLALAAPFVAFALRRRPDATAAAERRAATVAAIIAIAVMLPAIFRPRGFFAGAFPRYGALIVPIVVCLTIPPLFAHLRAAQQNRIAAILLSALVTLFALEAADCAVNDNFAPLDYVLRMRANPRSRAIYFDPNRAGSVVDRLAGPHDTVAIDGGFDTWSYPAYGEHWTRPIVYLDAAATPDSIARRAKWVVIDRSWNVRWTNKGLTTLGKYDAFFGKGQLQPEDVRLFDLLRRDPRFRLMFHDSRNNQAVFARL